MCLRGWKVPNEVTLASLVSLIKMMHGGDLWSHKATLPVINCSKLLTKLLKF